MVQFTRTWWGQRFLAALESFSDAARLGRGRSYARGDRIRSHAIRNGKVTAKVRGNVNPYFGVYQEPVYDTTVQVTPLPATQWRKIINHLAGKASSVAKLLMNEMPDDIEAAFSALGLHLLPRSAKDFTTHCSCPDFYNPCKHIAGVCYLLAGKLDQDPFLLFELRGLSREQLREALAKTPLGKTLAAALDTQALPPQPVASYYTRPRPMAVKPMSYDRYWYGEKRLPATLEPLPPVGGLPAILIRKGGDYPPFWEQDASFIEVMTAFYERIRQKNKDVL